MSAGIELWPDTASAHAGKIDLLIASFGAMVWVLTMPVFVLMTVFAFRYRRSRQVNREHASSGNVWMEASWSIILFALTIAFYVWSTALFLDLQRAPGDALPVNVVAKQWMWKFQHQEGAREINELHVPLGRSVRLLMTSQDVIHSLYVPALRIKQDVLPGRYTTMWFNADKVGNFDIRCAEFCGTDHSTMGAKLIVMRPEAYAAWLASDRDGGSAATLAELGAGLYRTLGCSGCHEGGAAVRAPSLEGLYGRPVALSDGTTTIAGEQYLADSILLPNKQVTAGYKPIMPTYSGVLDPEQVYALVAYLKTTRDEGGA